MNISFDLPCEILVKCLACNSSELQQVIDLGKQPLANSFHHEKQEKQKFPLILNFCQDCTHLQLSHNVDRTQIFSNYPYVSGTSLTLKKFFTDFAIKMIDEFSLSPGDVVLDVACNDGSQLDAFRDCGLITVGIDPAQNLYFETIKRHSVICSFLDPVHASFIRADLLLAQNVLAHTSNPLEFLTTCKLIAPNIVIQTSQAEMLENGQFDTLYHEHLSFFSPNSMRQLARRAGLKLIKYEKVPVHGESYVFYLSREGQDLDIAPSHTQSQISFFASRVRRTLSEIDHAILTERSMGRAVIGYGAAAKGMTVLNALSETVDFIIDDSPLKQGMYSPGKNVPILEIDTLSNIDTPISILLFAWNFEEEIRNRLSTLGVKGARFIKYFPQVVVQ